MRVCPAGRLPYEAAAGARLPGPGGTVSLTHAPRVRGRVGGAGPSLLQRTVQGVGRVADAAGQLRMGVCGGLRDLGLQSC